MEEMKKREEEVWKGSVKGREGGKRKVYVLLFERNLIKRPRKGWKLYEENCFRRSNYSSLIKRCWRPIKVDLLGITFIEFKCCT